MSRGFVWTCGAIDPGIGQCGQRAEANLTVCLLLLSESTSEERDMSGAAGRDRAQV